MDKLEQLFGPDMTARLGGLVSTMDQKRRMKCGCAPF